MTLNFIRHSDQEFHMAAPQYILVILVFLYVTLLKEHLGQLANKDY